MLSFPSLNKLATATVKNRVEFSQLSTELNRLEKEKRNELRMFNNEIQRFKSKYLKTDFGPDAPEAAEVKMYETHNPGFCFKRNGEHKVRQVTENTPMIDPEHFHFLLFTDGEIDIEKILCLHLLSSHETDHLTPPRRPRTSNSTKKDSPLEQIIERSNNLKDTALAKIMPTYVLDVKSSKRTLMDERLSARLLVNEKILELIMTVITALEGSNPEKVRHLISVAEDPSSLKRIFRKQHIQDFVMTLKDYSLVNSCSSFILTQPNKIKPQHLEIKTATGALEDLVKFIRSNVLQFPKPTSWDLLETESREKVTIEHFPLPSVKTSVLGGVKRKLPKFENLEDGKKIFEDGKKVFEDGKKIFEDGIKVFEDGKQVLEEGKKILKDKKKLVEGGKQIVKDTVKNEAKSFRRKAVNYVKKNIESIASYMPNIDILDVEDDDDDDELTFRRRGTRKSEYYNRRSTVVSPAGNRRSTVAYAAGNRRSTVGSSSRRTTVANTGNRRMTVANQGGGRRPTVASPAGNRRSTVGNTAANRRATVANTGNRRMTVANQGGNRRSTVASPAGNRRSTVGNTAGNRRSTVANTVGNRRSTVNTANRRQTVAPTASHHHQRDQEVKAHLKQTTCPACMEKWKVPLPTPKVSKHVKSIVGSAEHIFQPIIKTDSIRRLSNLIEQEKFNLDAYDKRFSNPNATTIPAQPRRKTTQSSSFDLVALDTLGLEKIRHEIREKETLKKLQKFLTS